jgi:hypothetical protein
MDAQGCVPSKASVSGLPLANDGAMPEDTLEDSPMLRTLIVALAFPTALIGMALVGLHAG